MHTYRGLVDPLTMGIILHYMHITLHYMHNITLHYMHITLRCMHITLHAYIPRTSEPSD